MTTLSGNQEKAPTSSLRDSDKLRANKKAVANPAGEELNVTGT
jgi:hypothetical protein